MNEKIDQIFTTQSSHRFFVGNTSAKERKEKLRRMQRWLMEHKREIQQAMYSDFKKPSPEVDLSEIWALVTEIRHTRKHLKQWMRAKKVPPTLAMATTEAWIQTEPKGVVLIIAPWNFPFNLTLSPLISAIAAGNCAVIKPSELTPNSSALMGKMIQELFDENEVALIEGDATVAEALLNKQFHHIFFTGSPKIGSIVMERAAKNLSTVTLELGGKSPTIIDESANIKDAAKKIAWGKFLNCGQICLAPDYVLIQEKIKDKFLSALRSEVDRQFNKDMGSVQSSPDYARIVNSRHFERLKHVLDKSIESGATVVMGGEIDASENYIAPTVLTNISEESPIMSEEIFGPLLPIIPYGDLTKAVQFVNSKPKPLGLYIFSNRKKNINRILKETSAGGTSINDVIMHYMHLNLPFGGVNTSGFGRSHGYAGYLAFSNERAVMKQSRFSPMKLLYPPYTPRVKRLINMVLKYL